MIQRSRAFVLALSLALAAALALSACAGDSDRAKNQAAAKPYRAAFEAGFPDVILVEVTDDLPVTKASLVAPDGRTIEAQGIDTDRRRRGGGGISPSFGVGVGGGSSSGVGGGVGIGFPIFGSGGSAVSDEYHSIARIRLDDVAAYRAGWQRTQVKLQLGEAPDGREVVLPAPAPPVE
jgi:hypothetical protein